MSQHIAADGDALVGRRQGLERRILPAETPDRLGDGVRQRARAGAERGECRRGGQVGVAQRQIERVHPGMRVSEKPGGLGEREAMASSSRTLVAVSGSSLWTNVPIRVSPAN